MKNSLLKLFTLSLALGILGACSDDSPDFPAGGGGRSHGGKADEGGIEFREGGEGENPSPKPSPERPSEFQDHPTVQAYKNSGIDISFDSFLGTNAERLRGLSQLEELKGEILAARKDKIKKIKISLAFGYETTTQTLSLNSNASFEDTKAYLFANDKRILWQEGMGGLILTFAWETSDQLWSSMGVLDGFRDRLLEMKDAIREIQIYSSTVDSYKFPTRSLTLSTDDRSEKVGVALDHVKASYALQAYLGDGFQFETHSYTLDSLTDMFVELYRYRDDLKAVDPVVDNIVIDTQSSVRGIFFWTDTVMKKNILSVSAFSLNSNSQDLKQILASLSFQTQFAQVTSIPVEVARLRRGDLYNKGVDLMRATEASLKAKASRIGKVRIAEIDRPSTYFSDNKLLLISVYDTAARLQAVLDAI